jgi:uncharacterized protein (TIGR02996 family)
VSERDAFEQALRADHYDAVTRRVFADWLYEHGLDDEAAEQLRMAGDEWVKAARRMEEFASRGGETCVNYYEAAQYHREHGYDPDDNRFAYKPITFDQMIEIGWNWVRHKDYFIQQGSDSLRDDVGPLIEEYWQCWQVITGHTLAEGDISDEWGVKSPFSCSC